METLSSCAGLITTSLWSVSWQVTILVGIIWIVDRLSFRASSMFRYLLWCIVLLRLCVPVNMTIPVDMEKIFVRTTGIEIPDINLMIPFEPITERFEFETLPLTPSKETEPAGEKASMILYEYAVISWFLTVFFICILILLRVLWVNRCLKTCSSIKRPELCALFRRLKIEMGIKHIVGLHYMDIDNVDVPAVIGVIRPRIFLPHKIADEWKIDDIEPLLLHELVHVKRRDLFINWLQVIVQVLYFFHPLVWYSNRRIRQVREELCDDIAINRLREGRAYYTRSILRVMEETFREPSFGFAGIGFLERKHSLGERIKRIMSKKYKNNTKMNVFSIIMLVSIGILGFLISFGTSNLKGEENQTENIIVKENDSKKLNIFEILEQAKFVIVSGKGSYSSTQILDENEYARARAMLIKTASPLVPEHKLISNIYFTYTFDGPKSVSYEFNNQEHDVMVKKTIYNGEIRKQISYSYDQKGLLFYTKGIVTSKQIGDPAMVNPFFWTTHFLDSILKQYQNGHFNTVLLSKINYNGVTCDVITLEEVKKQKYILWVSPELGYNLVKIEITHMPKLNVEIIIEYDNYMDYYIPHKIISEKYRDGKFSSKHIIIFEDDWEFNIDIKSEEFTLDFPSGIRVYDELINDSYIVE